MKFLLLTLFSFSAMAQLEKPLVEANCSKGKISIDLTITSEILKASVKKAGLSKKCDLVIVNSSSTNRMPVEKETLYFVPSACDGRLAGETGFNRGPVIERGFFTISKTGNLYQGVASILTKEDAFLCDVKIRSWKKLEELSKKKRKLN